MERVLGTVRGLMAIAVTVLIAVTLTALVYGSYICVRTIHDVVVHPAPVAPNISGFLVVIDLFLIAATMLIASIGLYELFISRIDSRGVSPLPSWLLMRDLNDLKIRVIGMIVLVAAVTFIDILVDYRSSGEVLQVGAGVAMVIAALTVFSLFGSPKHGEH